MPVQQDIEVWRGNSLPQFVFPFPAGYVPDITGSEFELTMWVGTDLLFVVAGGTTLVIDVGAGVFRWAPTVAQGRLVPLGKVASYEIEQKSSVGELTVIWGFVTGAGGNNLDADFVIGNGELDFTDPNNTGLSIMGWSIAVTDYVDRTRSLDFSNPRNSALMMMGWM